MQHVPSTAGKRITATPRGTAELDIAGTGRSTFVTADAGSYPSSMVWPFDVPGRWVADGRGGGRGVRVSAHEEAGFLVLSTWKANVCVGTVRLLPDEAADLVAGVAEALGRLASRPTVDHGTADADLRLAAVEERLRRLEAQVDEPGGRAVTPT